MVFKAGEVERNLQMNKGVSAKAFWLRMVFFEKSNPSVLMLKSLEGGTFALSHSKMVNGFKHRNGRHQKSVN